MSKMLSYTSKYLAVFKQLMKSFNIKHFTPDGTLAWGTVKGIPVYVRYFLSANICRNLPDHSNLDIKEYLRGIADSGKIPDDTYATLIFRNVAGDMVAYVSTFKYIKMFSKYDVVEIAPEGFDFRHVMFLFGKTEDTRVNLVESYDMWSQLYVPFNNGPNGSLIPIMHCIGITGADDLIPSNIIYNGVEEFAHTVMRELEEKFPKVDLKEESDERFVEFSVSGRAYIYNRNNVAYNGKSSDVDSTSCLIFNEFSREYRNLISENVTAHVNESLASDSPYYVLFKGQEIKPEEKTEQTEEPKLRIGVIGHGRKSATTLMQAIENMNTQE